MFSRIVALQLVVALVSCVSTSWAGNDDEILLGNTAAMTAGAVTATEDSGSALYYNPAGLVEVEDNTIDASGSAYGIRHYDSDGLVVDPQGRAGDGALTEVVLVASAASYVRPIDDDIRVGFGLFVSRWTDFTLHSRLDTGAQKALMTVALSQQTINGIAGLGFAPLPGLRLGFTLHGVYSSGETSFQLGGGNGVAVNGVNATQSIFTSSTGVGLRLGAGVQWEISEVFVVGLSATTPAARIYSATSFDSLVSISLPSNINLFDADFEEKASFGWEWEQPARIRLGAAYRILDGGWVSLDGDIQTPLENDTLDIHRLVTWNLRAGIQAPVADGWKLGGGLFTDRSADEEQAGGHFYGGTFGMRYRSDRALDDSEDVDVLTFETVAALRYAYGNIEAGGLLVDFNAAEPEQLVQERSVTIPVHEVSLHIGGGLRF